MNTTRIARTVLVTAAVASVTLTAAGCGSSAKKSSTGGGATTGASSGDTITIKDFAFNALTVKAGATITVKNVDSAAHTVTADDKGFDTKSISGGATSTFTAPSKAGSYTYICSIHTYMKGTLTVTG